MNYTVTGSHPVDGHEPGETFEWDIDQVTEARLVAGGHIARADQVEETETETETPTNDDDEEERGFPHGA